jgi:hypothetical protein
LRHRLRLLVAVELLEELADQSPGVDVLDLLHHPAALAAHPAAAHVEDLHGRLELVLVDADDVGVGAVAEHDRVALHGPLQRGEVVAQPGRLLELQVGRGLLHLPLEVAGEAGGLPGQEGAEVLGDLPVLLGADPADARGRALADVAEQAGPVGQLRPAEDPLRAAAHREDPQQGVHRLADRPRVRVRTEVAHALLLGPAHHLDPRELLVEGHREARIRLVIPVLDVEPRVELLDPGVLQRERLDLVDHDGPLDAGRGGHHGLGARVQRGERLEVVGQARPEVVGLADVDDPPVLVAETVDPRLGRDGAGRRAVGGRIAHDLSLRLRTDSPGNPRGVGARSPGPAGCGPG